MKGTRLLLRSLLVLLICLGGFSAVSPASAAGNRCKDRCNDRYKIRKDGCKAIPYKHARHACEDAAKQAKNECKHRCR